MEASVNHEISPNPEVPKASEGLMLRIANGNFGEDTTALDRNPLEISQRSFDALNANHQQKREEDRDAYYQHIREELQKNGPLPEAKMLEPFLRHRHMKDWAFSEAFRLRTILANAQETKPAAFDTQVLALAKLHIVIDPNAKGLFAADQLYKTISDTSGIPGDFYQDFCTGNTNQKLINTLDVNEITALQDFLTGILGSREAFNALVSTKQTQDRLAQQNVFPTGDLPVQPNEQPILNFFQQAEQLLKGIPAKTQEKPQATIQPQPEIPSSLEIQGSKSEQAEDHEHNEDNFFLDAINLRGGILDGASGYGNGDQVSKAAQEALQRVLSSLSPNATEEEAKEKMAEAFTQANLAVQEKQKEIHNLKASTTAAAFQVVKSPDGTLKVLVGSIGDSRVWVRRADGSFVKVTQDGGSPLNDYLAQSQSASTQEESDNLRKRYQRVRDTLDSATTRDELHIQDLPEIQAYWNTRNQTNLLGSDNSRDQILFFESPIAPGDTILLTTDGIHDNLTTAQIEEIAKNEKDPQKLSELIVAKAKEVSKSGEFRSKPDDLTAVAIRIPSDQAA